MDKLKVIKNTWYDEGLPFKCTGCGKCCEGSPGYVWINNEEIELMAKHLKISVDSFKKKYTRLVGKRISLIELEKKNFACVFLKDNQCSIYEARPKQCRTYPFWPKVLESKKNWDEEASYCEGIRDHYPKRSKEEIKKIMDLKLDT